MDAATTKINNSLSFFSIFIGWIAGYLYKSFLYGYYSQSSFFYGSLVLLFLLWLFVFNSIIKICKKNNIKLKPITISFFGALTVGGIFVILSTLCVNSIDSYIAVFGYGAIVGGTYTLCYSLLSNNIFFLSYISSKNIKYLYIIPILFIPFFIFVIWPAVSYIAPALVCFTGTPQSSVKAKIIYLNSLKTGDNIGNSLTYESCMRNSGKQSIVSRSILSDKLHVGGSGDGCSYANCYSYDIKTKNGIINNIHVDSHTRKGY